MTDNNDTRKRGEKTANNAWEKFAEEALRHEKPKGGDKMPEGTWDKIAEDAKAFEQELKATAPPANYAAWQEMGEREFRAERDIVAITTFRENCRQYLDRLASTRDHLVLLNNSKAVGYLLAPEKMNYYLRLESLNKRASKLIEGWKETGSKEDLAPLVLRTLPPLIPPRD